jgi:crotonobetainyl-CoA:carnitine CoA-transferase CaiB-like acyl-CoA transferase
MKIVQATAAAKQAAADAFKDIEARKGQHFADIVRMIGAHREMLGILHNAGVPVQLILPLSEVLSTDGYKALELVNLVQGTNHTVTEIIEEDKRMYEAVVKAMNLDDPLMHMMPGGNA